MGLAVMRGMFGFLMYCEQVGEFHMGFERMLYIDIRSSAYHG